MKKLLFFHASWCPPCRFYEKQFITPLEDLAGPEYIERVDAWKFPQKAEKYMIDRLPASGSSGRGNNPYDPHRSNRH